MVSIILHDTFIHSSLLESSDVSAVVEGSHTELQFSLAPHDSDETLRASEIERGFRLKRRFSFVTFPEHSEGSPVVEGSQSG